MIPIMFKTFNDHLSTLKPASRRFSAGALIFDRDDLVDKLYRVDIGEVHLLRRQEDGSAFILQRARAGKILAEASLTSPRYHCAAVAVSQVSLSVFRRKDVLALVEKDSSVALSLAQHLGHEVRDARIRAEIVSLRRAADRLDAWLAWNDDKLPRKGQWHHVAREINVAPEVLYRELARRR